MAIFPQLHFLSSSAALPELHHHTSRPELRCGWVLGPYLLSHRLHWINTHCCKGAQPHGHSPSLRKVNKSGTCYSLLAHAGVISTSNSTPAFLQSRCLGSPKAQPLSPLIPCMSETSEMPKALCRDPCTSLVQSPNLCSRATCPGQATVMLQPELKQGQKKGGAEQEGSTQTQRGVRGSRARRDGVWGWRDRF